MKKFVLGLLCCSAMLFAKDFGERGHLFPIEEENLADYFQRAGKESAEKYLTHMQEKIQRPDSLGLPLATEEKSYLVELPGEFPMGMLFFDGDDPRQIEWAKEQEDDFLWMLVNGAPIEVEKQVGHEVFFDQMGFYSSHLKIQNIPAKASPENGNARVTQFLLKEIK